MLEDFAHIQSCHGVLGCGDEVEVFVFDFVEDIGEVA